MLWQIILTAAGILCLAYYGLICAVLRKWNTTFSRFWIAAGILFGVCGQVPENSGARRPLFFFLAGAAVLFIYTQIRIIQGMYAGRTDSCSVLIVLGAHVEGREISESLRRRLARAHQYYIDDPRVRIIVSGGKGKGEDITEAEAMKDYLLQKGVPEDKILCEDRSTTTRENLLYSFRYLQSPREAAGIVTNNFHVYRALALARRLGYERTIPVPCGCPPVLLVNYMVREFFAVWKMWLTR